MRRRNLSGTIAASPRHFCSTSGGFYDDVGGLPDGDNGDGDQQGGVGIVLDDNNGDDQGQPRPHWWR